MRCVRLVTALALLTSAAGLPAPLRAATVTVALTPVRDNTLFQDATGSLSNGSGPALFAGVSGTGNVRRAVLAFAIAEAIPEGATIDSATLVLRVAQVSDPSPRTMTLHRLFADWGEGASSTASGAGAPAAPGDATWLHTFFPDALWAAAGGDFEPAPSTATTVGGVGSYVWSGPGLVADLRAWLDTPAANHGWMLRGDESASGTARRFESRESSSAGVRPTLTIHFTPGTTEVARTGWSRLKARYRQEGHAPPIRGR